MEPSAPGAPGQPLVAGRYRLLRRLGVGGMGEVWLANVEGPAGFEKLAALKVTSPSLSEDPAFVEMFLDEARISAQLSHTNIAQIHELGQVGGRYFLAMEYVQGRSLAELLRALSARGERLPVPLACFVISELCQGLDHAHRRAAPSGEPLGIVHRDVTPQNCLISEAGEVKLIDFGIATAASRTTRTEAGMLKGKFAYMSPEQAYARQVDRRSDVFAAGTVLWEALAGRRLFDRETDIGVLEAVRQAAIPPLAPAIPEELDRVLLRALSLDREQRFQWASELHHELQRFLVRDGQPIGRADLVAWLRGAGLLLPAAEATQPAPVSPPRTASRPPEPIVRRSGPLAAFVYLLAPLGILLLLAMIAALASGWLSGPTGTEARALPAPVAHP